jgi:two-component system, sensor histidine kinase ChiS
LGPETLKGKMEATSIFECFNGPDEHAMNNKLKALPFFKPGMFNYFNKSFNEASDHFYQVLEIYPEDPTAKFFLGKVSQCLDMGIPENWTGVEEMHNK